MVVLQKCNIFVTIKVIKDFLTHKNLLIMSTRTTISGKYYKTLQELKKIFGLDDSDNKEAVEIALELVKLNLDENSTAIKYLKGKNEDLSLTQIQAKYKVNYTTLQNFDKKLNDDN